jgi:hypothetical protein
MNIQYSGINEYMGSHLSKVLFVAEIFNNHQETLLFAVFHCLSLGEWLILTHNTTHRTLNCLDKVTSFINSLRWLKLCQEKSTYVLPMYHGFLEKKQLFSSQQCI